MIAQNQRRYQGGEGMETRTDIIVARSSKTERGCNQQKQKTGTESHWIEKEEEKNEMKNKAVLFSRLAALNNKGLKVYAVLPG